MKMFTFKTNVSGSYIITKGKCATPGGKNCGTNAFQANIKTWNEIVQWRQLSWNEHVLGFKIFFKH